MKTFFAKNIKKIFGISLGILFAFSFSYISATQRPSSVDTDAPSSIDVGTELQSKGDTSYPDGGQISLKGFLVGFIPKDLGSFGCNTDDKMDYTYFSEGGAMSVGRCKPGTGITLDIKGKDGVKGTIRSSAFAHTEDVNVPICADATGLISLCGEEIVYTYDEDNGENIYPFMVPRGVSSLTVTIYGAGGAGFANANKNGFDADGGDSFVRGKDVSLIASGGKSAKVLGIYGKGGEPVINVSNNKADAEGESGGDGENPPSFNPNSSIILSGNCSGTTYYIEQGGSGNTGGKGGAPYGGSKTSGGTGGNPAPISGSGWDFKNGGNINCDLANSTADDHLSGDLVNYRPGGDGGDGEIGAGGGGFGGKGGGSVLGTSCSYFSMFPADCEGGYSGAGGGAGAYINADINVTSGEMLYVKVGKGGEPQIDPCYGTNCNRDEVGGGAVSGRGGDGKVIVYFNYNS